MTVLTVEKEECVLRGYVPLEKIQVQDLTACKSLCCDQQIAGPSCSKITTLLVNVTLKFQTHYT